MTKTFSTYLDAVRFLAALTVVFSHLTFAQFMGGLVPYQGALANMPVTTFFVLSGYVIAYVSQEKERTLTDFAASRCARIYSVAIPALLLTMAIDGALLLMGGGENIPMYEYHGILKYMPVFLTFSSDIWTFHIKVLTDGPFWSLSYEVWYYVTFACAFYLSGWRRIVMLPLCLVWLGIPALLYFPVWLLGCAVYYLHKRTSFPKPWARLIALSSAVALVGLRATGLDDAFDRSVNAYFGGWPVEHLHNSMHFPIHYVVGVLVALHFYAVRYCDLRVLAVPRIRSIVVGAASFTFAIYLGHRPLIDFWALVIHHDPHSPMSIVLLIVLVLASVFLFAFVSERRKKEWRRLFQWLFYRLGDHGRVSRPAHAGERTRSQPLVSAIPKTHPHLPPGC